MVIAPPWLDELEQTLDRLQTAWPRELRMRSPMYSHFCWTPVRFAPAFPRVREEEVKSLTVFCHLFVAAVLAQDPLLDRKCPVEQAGVTAMHIMALEAEAYAVLHRLFPAESPFWPRYRACLADHARAFLVEEAFRNRQRPLAEYDEAVALRAAADKIGLVRIVIAALAELAGDDRLYEPICASVARVGEAMGMYDDLFDWKDDLRRGQPSLLLSRTLHEAPGPLDDEAFAALAREVGRAIHYGGHSRYVLELALRALDEADELEALVPGLQWYQHTHDLREHCVAVLRELETTVRRDLDRARAAGPGPGRAPRPASPLVRPWAAVA